MIAYSIGWVQECEIHFFIHNRNQFIDWQSIRNAQYHNYLFTMSHSPLPSK